MSKRPENVAALVNGLLVLLAPTSFLVFGSCVFDRNSQYSVTVRASDPAPWADAVDHLLILGLLVGLFLRTAAVLVLRFYEESAPT